jgi:hypothetical protein
MFRKLIKKIRKKTPIERLKEIKEKEMIRMKEEKTSGPWRHIEPENLIKEVLELYDLFERRKLKVAKVKLEEVSEKIAKIKDKKVKASNERFVQWIDDRIATGLLSDELEEEREKL